MRGLTTRCLPPATRHALPAPPPTAYHPPPAGNCLPPAAVRLADRPNSVTDEIWDAAADHYDEQGLAAIILMVAVTNMFNRINTTIREPAGAVRS